MEMLTVEVMQNNITTKHLINKKVLCTTCHDKKTLKEKQSKKK
jgi:hypothetical protein